MAWDELIRKGLTLCGTSSILESIRYSRIGPVSFSRIIVYSKKGTFWWYESIKDHETVGNYIVEESLKEKDFLLEHKKKWIAEFHSLQESISKFRAMNYSLLSDKELWNAYSELNEKYTIFHGIAFDTDAIDTVLNPLVEKEIRNAIKENLGEQKERVFSQYYNLFTTPNELSYVNRENIELFETIQLIEKEKMKKAFLTEKPGELKKILPEKITQKIEGIAKKFYWTNFGWPMEKEKSFSNVVEAIKRLFSEKINAAAELEKLKNHESETKKEKETALKTINAGKRLEELLFILEEYAILHDFRKEGQMKAKNELQKIASEVSKRKKIDRSTIEMLWPEEIRLALLENKQMEEIAKKRTEECLIDIDLKGKREYFGKEALEKKKELVEIAIDENLIDIQGMTASLGKVTGRAKIAFSAKDALKKIEKGDILVSGMTTPEFVPAMKKAAGIITDEGGITCHAAIIAREFRIPCIVGTKLATRVIKDNDTVELNANHGVARVIKK